MATIIDIADAIVAEINGKAWSKEFTATRELRPSFDLEKLTTTRCSVAPRKKAVDFGNRGANDVSHTLEILLLGKAATDEAAVEFIGLMEEIEKHFLNTRRLCRYKNAGLFGCEITPVYDQKILDEHKVFASVLALTYRADQ